MHNLSKSRYTAYCQCPKNMWLGVCHPEKMDKIDAALQARFESGSQVGELAKQLFPGTVDVSTRIGEALDLKAMIEKTQQCMASGAECIAEASFSHEGCYCAVDLLCREGDGWAIYEVKSTTDKDDKGKLKNFDKYLPDIAYQTWVLRQFGINVTGINLVCLNHDYVRQGNLNPQQLFAIIDIREAVEAELAKVPMQVSDALSVLKQEDEPDIDLSENCEKPYHCLFWNYCARHLPEDSVFKVYGSSTGKGDLTFHIDKKLAHYRAGRVSYEQLADQPLGIIQRMQVERETHIDHDGIRKFLDGLSYPLFFLDFETMQDVVPQYDGTHPCQQIPFQYSLHVVNDPSKICDKQGYGYLAPSDGGDPRCALAEDLCHHIPKGVCTLAYNMSFEKGRIKELAKTYPDLADHLMDIHDHIIDLIEPFRAGFFYLPAMGGSFSIKSVLPALFPNDQDLDYHNLSGTVHNGSEAMKLFPKIVNMSLNEQTIARESLLQYCNLDTWAMVKVWEKLKSCVN